MHFDMNQVQVRYVGVNHSYTVFHREALTFLVSYCSDMKMSQVSYKALDASSVGIICSAELMKTGLGYVGSETYM